MAERLVGELFDPWMDGWPGMTNAESIVYLFFVLFFCTSVNIGNDGTWFMVR